MQKNKVIQVLNSLSAKELREADKFVRSPIHNKHQDVIRLFQYLRKNLDKAEKNLNRERVFDHLFPGEKFEMQKVHHVSSYLLNVLEEYLAWKEWRKDEPDFRLQLTKAYGNLKLDGQFKNILKKAKSGIKAKPHRDAPFYLHNYQLQLEEFKFARRLGRMREFNLQMLSDSQDIAFLIDKLKNACLLLSHQTIIKTTYDKRFLDAILDFLRQDKLLDTPAIAMYYYGYQALSDLNDEESFLELKRLLGEKIDTFEVSELRDLFILAINFCIKKINSDDESYTKELFDIYLEGLRVDVFIDNGELSPFTYKNFVQSGLKLQEFDKVESFIHKYKNFLPPLQRENFFNLNLAWLNYEKKQYQAAMQLLLKMDLSKDVLTACAVRTLMARMLYEQKEYESLSSHLSSFQVFINRKKAIGYHRERYTEFIKLLRRVSNTHFVDKAHVQALKSEILNTKVAAKEWLLDQLHN